jgi:hypothetical protein
MGKQWHLTGNDRSRRFDLPSPSCPSRPPPHTYSEPSLVIAAHESKLQKRRMTRCCASSSTRRGRSSTSESRPSTRPWPSWLTIQIHVGGEGRGADGDLAQEVTPPRVNMTVFGQSQRMVGTADNLIRCEAKCRRGGGASAHLADAGFQDRGNAHWQRADIFAIRKAKLPSLVAAANVQLPCRKNHR